MKNKKYVDADSMITYLKGLQKQDLTGYGKYELLDMIVSSVQFDAEKMDTTTAILDWRSPDVWPRKEDADSKGGVLAVHKDDGHVSRWKASSVIEYPWNFFCWAPMPKMPDDLMRPQEGKDGQE